MRLNVAIFDNEKNYIERLAKYFQLNYPKKINVRLFSDDQEFVSAVKKGSFDVSIVGLEYIGLISQIKDSVIVGVFAKENSIDNIDGIRAIGKYQNAESIFKQIVGLYADNSANVVLKTENHISKTVMFTSGQGGSGTSTLAAAFSVNKSKSGQKVLYLNMESFNSTDLMFDGNGYGSFSDAIYALKNSNVNFTMKLQSLVRTNSNGVDFIPGCKNAYDMTEITLPEISKLINELKSINNYELIVIDCSGTLTERQLYLMKNHADSIIYVNDGSDIGNQKFMCFCEALHVIEMREDISILKKMAHMYNRFSSKTSAQLERMPIEALGGINRVEGLHQKNLIAKLSDDTLFEKIV